MAETEWPAIPSPYFTSPMACSCPDYVHRRMRIGGHCKHQLALMAALELVAATNRKWEATNGTSR